jgi:DsbC/DsbD-like thiol-disulfide interchange protein
MRMFLRLAGLALAFAPGFGVCRAESVQTSHAKVELLAQSSAISPGQKVWLGLHFSLEKGWHIYWKNPGDSGQPPVLRWELPPGFRAGEVRWPRPQKLKTSFLAGYGYEDDAMLLVFIRVPGSAKIGSPAEISLQAKWLICQEVCLPDQAQFHLSLPVAVSPVEDKNYAKLFADARKLLPKPWPASWAAAAVSGNDAFVLNLRTGKPLQAGEFFPSEPNQIENAAPQTWEAAPQGAKITLKKSEQLLRPVSILKGVLVLGSDSYEMRARVTVR